MTASPKAIAQSLEEIVGEAGVATYPTLNAHQQAQVLQTVAPGTKVDCIVYPKTQAELSEVMACAYRNQWRVLPCGSGTKLSWGEIMPGIDLVVSTQQLNRLIEHAAGDLTVTVEAGMKFSDLQTALATANQFLALDPAYSTQATVGGIVATRDTGSLRQGYGGVRDMTLGASFVRADGQRVKAGGRVVKNVAGYDLTKLLCGSFGTLGIISEITFRLYPLPEASKTVLLVGAAELIAQVVTTLTTSVLTPIALDLLSPQVWAVALAAVGTPSGLDTTGLDQSRSLGLVVRFQNLEASVNYQVATLLKVAHALGLKGETLVAAEETSFWQQVQNLLWQQGQKNGQSVLCKFGVLPARAVSTLITMEAIGHQHQLSYRSLIHAGSGLGLICLDGAEPGIYQALLALRSLCEQADVQPSTHPRPSGFLTVLEAPVKLKQQVDVWGYAGNALNLMRKIKQQFDPQNLFSPHRFIGGI